VPVGGELPHIVSIMCIVTTAKYAVAAPTGVSNDIAINALAVEPTFVQNVQLGLHRSQNPENSVLFVGSLAGRARLRNEQ
jgi:hypothetical protein